MASTKEDGGSPLVDWKSTAPNDNFSCFTNGDTTVILKTLETFTLRPSDRFETKSLCVYAETIRLDGDIVLPGKDLVLVCNKLLLPQGKKTALISVSGRAGDPVTANTPPGAANHGGHGGSIVLCVEEFDPDSLTPRRGANGEKVGLFMQAYGGAGGTGTTNIGDGKETGGAGGKGGDGGNISVYFGHHLNDMATAFSSLASDPHIPWFAKLKKLQTFDFQGYVSPKTKEHIAEVTQQGINVASAVDDIRQLLHHVDFDNAPPDSISKLAELVYNIQRAPTECVTESTSKAILASRDVLDKMRQTAPPYLVTLWDDFQKTTPAVIGELEKALSTPVKDTDSVVQIAVSNTVKELHATVHHVTQGMMMFYSCLGGNGGRGGQGALPGSESGANGAPGDSSHRAKIETLDFSEPERSLSFPDVLAHPDQCQMMLNQADLMYFAASGGEIVKDITQRQMKDRQSALDGGTRVPVASSDDKPAAGSQFEDVTGVPAASSDDKPAAASQFEDVRKLYQRLLRRLHFVPALKKQLTVGAGAGRDLSTLTPEEKRQYGLALAYAVMAQSSLSLEPIAQVLQIYEHAAQNSERASMGKDFMGHDGLWAPRLTYRVYEKQLRSLKQDLSELANSFREIQGKEAAQSALKKTQDTMQLQVEGLDTRIRLLTAPSSGKLAMLGTQIANFTPILRVKRNLLQDLIIDAKIKIAYELNLDPKIFLDALSMIAFAPEGFNIAAQSASGIYKCATTVQSLDGQAVDKSYVISQFGDAGSTLESLAEGYMARPDGPGIAVDDPGASKLLSTKADLMRLVKKFSETIGRVLHAKIETELNAYVGFVEKRNSAVMEYNASVQLLAKALADKAYYQAKQEHFGQVILSYDAQSPTVRLWLVKFRQDLRESLLATMYCAERSLQFWGVMKPFARIPMAENFSDVGLLNDRLLYFGTVFTNTLTRMAGNAGTIWPGLGPRAPRGKFFNLPPEIVKVFRERPTTHTTTDLKGKPKTSLLYATFFTIPPARSDSEKTDTEFAKSADVRIDSVTAWLYGAMVGRKNGKNELTVLLTHMGDDTIVSPDDDAFGFHHDSVMTRCTYDPTHLKTVDDIPAAAVYESSRWPSFRDLAVQAKEETSDEVVASIGPFATWRLWVWSTDNLDLDMSGLTGIAIEFTGASRVLGTQPVTDKKP